MSATGLRVHATGAQCLVEDLGRQGLTSIGVGRSGAADRGSLRRANRALANEEGDAALEVTLGGLVVEPVGGPVWLCVTGAPCPVTVDGRDVGADTVFSAPAGAVVRLGTPERGLRSYLAVRGGVAVEPVLGSRSHDVMAALGPDQVAEGDLLPVGRPGDSQPTVDSVLPLALPALDEPLVLRAVRGPRDGWLAEADRLVSTSWAASERSNRVGMRLQASSAEAGGGEAPVLRHADEAPPLPSEGAWRGAVQVPPDGEPVLLLADHPVTGGYPVVAVVVDIDVDLAAQARPGQLVRFRWTSPR
ncbi:biotin-dependent carboxyltransferase family protein [uncultured Nocardioides sp.]|uniref:5-oxoprolinase subunit C family protein n=1 Tax=uncultured Nocardioides sp. TaxID=198441 RepID=UPI0025D02CEF|nr:biotin-dependent carboxyltransferase family protein [uncultured Nocardioides sp.]